MEGKFKKGHWVYSIINSTEGKLRTLKQIDESYVNTVLFTDGSTQQKSMIEYDWVSINEANPQTEVIAIGYQQEMLIGWIDQFNTACESDGQLLDDVTHWRYKPEPPKQQNK